MVELGMAYKRGEGVERNVRLAARWWRRANETEDRSMASFNLGQLLLESAEEIAPEVAPTLLVDPVASAVGLFVAAIEQGHPASASPGYRLACHNLGIAHMHGRGGAPQDADRAAMYLGWAGSAQAMRLAAQLHASRGRTGAATRWMRRAANAGDEEARQWLRPSPHVSPLLSDRDEL
mmetsp:Transcript_13070/g.33509  ORF Transcript_13070/g.33509 Transcript_13070/m.33509 type:complete len:178 (-) Transcript_13070:148-681(-)